MVEHFATAQNAINHPLDVAASLPSQIVKNATDLKLKILIKNTSNIKINVYKFLVEGYTQDPFTNLNLVVEQKGNKGFHNYSRRSLYQMLPDMDSIDAIERVELNSKDSLVLFYHLDDAYLFVPGSYRMKCIYKNDIKQSDKIYTAWVYFRLDKTIPTSHNHND